MITFRQIASGVVIAIMLLSTIMAALADDNQTQILIGGDDEMQIYYHTVFQDGNLTTRVTNSGHSTNTSTNNNQGVSTAGGSTHSYIIKILSIDDPISPGQNLTAKVKITLLGHPPSAKEAELHYTIISPDGNHLPGNTKRLPEGSYEQTIAYAIPDAAAPGEWTLQVQWSAPGLQTMTTTKPFDVEIPTDLPKEYLLYAAGFILFVIVVIIGAFLTATKVSSGRRRSPRRDPWER